MLGTNSCLVIDVSRRIIFLSRSSFLTYFNAFYLAILLRYLFTRMCLGCINVSLKLPSKVVMSQLTLCRCLMPITF